MRTSWMRRLFVSVAALALTTGAAVAETPVLVPEETQFFLHWVGCGAGVSDLFLSPDHPGGTVNGCGPAGGAPLNTIYETTGVANTIVREFPTKTGSGVPLVLDVDRPVEGEVRIHRWTGTGSGVGQVDVETILRARINNRLVELGRSRSEQIVTPTAAHAQFPFTMTLDASTFAEATVTQLQLDVIVRGVHVNSGVIVTQGLSYVTVPTLVPEPPPSP